MKKLFSAMMLVTTLSLSAVAQEKEIKQVETAVETLRAAMISGDGKILEKITSPTLSYGHSSGKVEDQNSFVQTLVSGQSDFVSIDLTGQTISVTGSTAIVRHTLSAQTNDGGNPGSVKLHILLVWHKEKKEWKLVARQAVKVL